MTDSVALWQKHALGAMMRAEAGAQQVRKNTKEMMFYLVPACVLGSWL